MWSWRRRCEHHSASVSKVICLACSNLVPFEEPVTLGEHVQLTRPSEIAPAKERGKFVTMNHVGFIAGMAVGLW